MFRLARGQAFIRRVSSRLVAPNQPSLRTFVASQNSCAGKAKPRVATVRSRPGTSEDAVSVDDETEGITAEIAERNLASTETQVAGNPITLRPYQEEALTACVEALERGKLRIGVSSPTGSGKTTMFMNLIPRVPPRNGGNQVLIIVGSVELAQQAESAARSLLPGYSIEVEQAKRVASGSADV